MSVASDLFAVQRRIDAIAGTSARVTAPPLPIVASLRRSVSSSAQHRAEAVDFGHLVSTNVERLARESAISAGVDPALVRAVIMVESGGNPSATSSAGAAGLMQLMPQTAQALGVTNPYDPAQNVRGGTTYLRRLLDRFHGEIPTAVAAYNAGPEAVRRSGGIPPYAETQLYVARVMAAYRASRAP